MKFFIQTATAISWDSEIKENGGEILDRFKGLMLQQEVAELAGTVWELAGYLGLLKVLS